MKAAKTRMRSAFGQGGFLASVGALAALAASIVAFSATLRWRRTPSAPVCSRPSPPAAGRAARRPPSSVSAAELGRTRAYAGSLGCGNRKFLFFGSEPPPQCGEVNAQISRMEANLADLQARAGGGAGDLVARYNAECGRAQPSGPGNVFEALFGGIARLGAAVRDQEPQTDARFEDHGDQPRQSAPSGEKGACRRIPAPMRYACGPATAASSPFPIPAPEAGRTASRTSAGPYAPTPTWPSIRSRSAARSKRPRRRPASLTQICPTPANSRKASIRAAPAGARGRAGRKRLPTRKRGMATRSTTFW